MPRFLHLVKVQSLTVVLWPNTTANWQCQSKHWKRVITTFWKCCVRTVVCWKRLLVPVLCLSLILIF